MATKPSASTRGHVTGQYAFITPENHVDNRLPGLADVVARPLATPRWTNARFGQYLLLFGPSGRSTLPLGRGYESFIYQVDGAVTVESAEGRLTLAADDFLYLAPDTEFSVAIEGAGPATTLWTKRRYEAVEGVSRPGAVRGHRQDVPVIEPGPPATYTFQELIPCADPAHDMAMNVLTAPPGGSIGLVEIHHQEHGLLMLEGEGVYYLAGDYHDVRVGDYIYMAPYCPQSFWATGEKGGAYLLYKDVNRDGF